MRSSNGSRACTALPIGFQISICRQLTKRKSCRCSNKSVWCIQLQRNQGAFRLASGEIMVEFGAAAGARRTGSGTNQTSEWQIDKDQLRRIKSADGLGSHSRFVWSEKESRDWTRQNSASHSSARAKSSPDQITNDLENFWRETYPKIKKELQRKYPKHEWR